MTAALDLHDIDCICFPHCSEKHRRPQHPAQNKNSFPIIMIGKLFLFPYRKRQYPNSCSQVYHFLRFRASVSFSARKLLHLLESFYKAAERIDYSSLSLWERCRASARRRGYKGAICSKCKEASKALSLTQTARCFESFLFVVWLSHPCTLSTASRSPSSRGRGFGVRHARQQFHVDLV